MEEKKINDPRKKSFHTAIDINLLLIYYIKTREYFSIIRPRFAEQPSETNVSQRKEKGYFSTLWCNICKVLFRVGRAWLRVDVLRSHVEKVSAASRETVTGARTLWRIARSIFRQHHVATNSWKAPINIRSQTPMAIPDIDLCTIFSETNFFSFAFPSISTTPRRSPNSFYFSTLFNFSADSGRSLCARSSGERDEMSCSEDLLSIQGVTCC